MRRDLALPLALSAATLGAWALAATRLPPVLLPSPWEVALEVRAQAPRLATATAWTALAAALGLALATLGGAGGAVLFLRSRALEAALRPYALLLQTVPVVAIAPLLVVWLGYGLPVGVATAAIVSFFPILTATRDGLGAVSQDELDLLRLNGATRWQELRLLRAPASLPRVFTGLRTAVGLSVIGAIVGEFVGSNGDPPTLGFLVLRSARAAETGLTFAAIFASTGLALAAFEGVRRLERRLIGRWSSGAAR